MTQLESIPSPLATPSLTPIAVKTGFLVLSGSTSYSINVKINSQNTPVFWMGSDTNRYSKIKVIGAAASTGTITMTYVQSTDHVITGIVACSSSSDFTITSETSSADCCYKVKTVRESYSFDVNTNNETPQLPRERRGSYDPIIIVTPPDTVDE